MRVLVVTPFTPSARAPHGAARAVAGLVGALTATAEVGVVHVADDGERADPDLIARCAFVRAVARPPAPRGRRLRLIEGLLRGRPMWTQAFVGPALDTAIATAVRDLRPDVVQVEMEVLGRVLRRARTWHGRPATVLVVHDPAVPAAWRAMRGRRWLDLALHALDLTAWWRSTRRALRRADAVVAFTDDDAATLRRLDRADVDVVPLGVDLPAATSRRAARRRPGELVFVGGDGHPPNREAAERLVRRILPRLVSARDDVRLVLVGARERVPVAADGCDECCPHLEVTGAVADASVFVERAALAVAPIDSGGGMRVKVLEAMALGTPVVASERALAGTGAAAAGAAVAARGDDEFCREVLALLDDPARRRAIGAAGGRHVAATLAWPVVAARWTALHHRLATTGASPAGPPITRRRR